MGGGLSTVGHSLSARGWAANSSSHYLPACGIKPTDDDMDEDAGNKQQDVTFYQHEHHRCVHLRTLA